MKFKKTILNILGIGLLIGLLLLFYIIAKTAWSSLVSINITLAVGIVAAGSTILVSVISVLISKHLEQRALIINEHRKKKIPVYEELLVFLFKILMAPKIEEKQPTEQEMIKFMSEFTQKVLIWGSDDVISSLFKYKQVGIASLDNPNPEIMFSLEDLLLSIRKDLGHKNVGLSRGTLLGLFINDISAFIKKHNH